jgi:hypothetical protein
MPNSRLILVGACFATLFSCTSPTSEPMTGTGGSGGSSSGSAGTTGTAGTAGTTGTTGTGGSTSGTAGTTGTGGSTSGTAGTTARGGTTGTAGSTAGTTGTAGAGGTTSRGGTTGTAGSAAGTTGTAGTGGTAPMTDQNGIPIAKPGDMITTTKQYLNLGEMRLINNRWGSDAENCNPATVQRVYITGDKLIGYDFTRGVCDASHGHPDFPEIEFGIAPFGTGSSLLTSPAFSSTTLLPIQIKNLTSASVDMQNFVTTIQSADPPSYWDSNFEFWISKNDPRTANGGVYAEIIMFMNYEKNRTNSSSGGWTCDTGIKAGPVTAGAFGFTQCHQSDTWSNGQWRFFNFNVNGGSMTTVNGKADIKAILTWIMNNYTGFTTDMWLTRIEVGTEVDDMTKGSVRLNNLVFEINGQTRSMTLSQ